MGGKSSKVTVGYKYYLGWHMVLCHGHIDSLSAVYVDKRVAWEGLAESGSVTVDAPELFGGDGREGGVSGTLDMLLGEPTQLSNAYLSGQLGEDVPAFRGVTSIVGNQVYMGNNPYLKPWAFQIQRIDITTDYQEQWYSEKAAIFDPELGCADGASPCDASENYGISVADVTNYKLVDPCTEQVNSSDPTFIPDFIQSSVELNPPQTYVGQNFDFFNVVSKPNNPLNVCYENTYGFMVVDDFGDEYIALQDRGGIGLILANSSGGDFDIRGVEDVFGNSMGIYLTGGNWTASYGAAITYISGPQADNTGTTVYGTDEIFPISVRVAIDDLYYSGGSTFFKMRMTATSPKFGTVEAVHTNYIGGSGIYDINEDNIEYRIHGNTPIVEFIGGPGFDTDDWLNTLQEAVDGADGQINATLDGCDCLDMNPAHIIRECMTDGDWGLGFSDSDIDDTSFTQAADTLYNESMGISLMWSEEMPIEDFVSEILRHIDGVLYVDRVTGKFVLKLVRNDNALSDMITLDEDTNVVNIKDARRPAVAELTSSVTVNYHSRLTDETASVTEHNQALISIQGSSTHTTVQYPGFTNHGTASRAAQRDMRALSTPLLSCTVYANREAELLNVGEAFILNAPTQGIDSTVMRVQQIKFGDGRRNVVEIEALEDVFTFPEEVETTGRPAGLWVDPLSSTPAASAPRVVTEAPYYQVVITEGESSTNSILSDDNDAGFLLVAGGRRGNEISADGYTDSGAGYSKTFILDFSPYGYLSQSITETDTFFYLTEDNDLDLVETGTIAQIEDELVRVDGIAQDSNGYLVQVGRGVLDTVPAAHEIGSDAIPVVFLGYSPETDSVQYTASDSVDVKLRTILGSNILTLAAAPEDSVLFDSRAYRPYPPGNLRVNGSSYPDLSSNAVFYDGATLLQWSHRDRLQQTDGNFYDYTEGDIGPEAGTTYRVDGYSTLINGTQSGIWLTVNVGSDTSWQQDSDTDSNAGEPPSDSAYIHFKVTSVRNGYDSWQSPVVTLIYDLDSNTTDPYFSSVVSLLNFPNLADGTTITDVIAGNTWTANGDAAISSGVLECDGAGDYIAHTDVLSFRDEFNGVSSSNWTAEFKVRLDTTSGGQQNIWAWGPSGDKGILLCQRPVDATEIGLFVGDSTDGWEDSAVSGTSTVSAGNTYEIAVTRNGNDYYLHVDGVYKDKATTAVALNLGSSGMDIMSAPNNGSPAACDGGVLRARFTAGVSRYAESADYTPEAGNTYPES